jgi:hypothetical protein
LSLPARLLFVGFRILAWPLTGLLTNGLAIGVVVSVVVVAGLAWLAWRAEATSERERTAARWFAVTLLFGWIALTFGAPGLSTVTPLPTDHYHAFLDPVVFVALGLGAAAVWRRVGGPLGPGRVAVAAGIALLVTWNVTVWPRAVAADGGWPAGRLAADRIEATAGDRTIRFVGLPSFKSTEAYAFPLARDGRHVSGGGTYDALAAPGAARDATIVIVCDAIFVDDCGGAAEAAALASGSAGGVDLGQLSLADRFTAAPGRTISVYLPWP